MMLLSNRPGGCSKPDMDGLRIKGRFPDCKSASGYGQASQPLAEFDSEDGWADSEMGRGKMLEDAIVMARCGGECPSSSLPCKID